MPRPAQSILLSIVALPIAFAVAAAPARAAEALSLRWNECAPDPTARDNRISGCDFNFTDHLLFAAFETAAAIDSVLGMELVVDLQHEDATLPDWWRLDPKGCRWGGMNASLDFSAFAGCLDPWQGEGAAAIQDYTPGQPYGGPSQARLRVAAALPGTAEPRTLEPGNVYYGVRLVLNQLETTGPGACAGCAGPACLVLNSILIRRVPGSAGGDVLLTLPGAGEANWARWQGGSNPSCAAVPVRRSTWGQVKGLYR